MKVRAFRVNSQFCGNIRIVNSLDFISRSQIEKMAQDNNWGGCNCPTTEIPKIPEIQSGRIEVQIQRNPSWQEFPVVFPTPFTNIPNVVTTPEGSGNQDRRAYFEAVKDISNTGFTIRVYARRDINLSFQYIAFNNNI